MLLIMEVAGGNAAMASPLTLSSAKLTGYRTCVITGNPSTSTAVIDSGVQQGAPTSNFGTATTTTAQSALLSNQRSYLTFDLSRCSPAILSSATVSVATLRLYLSGLPTACRTELLFKVLAPWAEGTITWNNQPFGTTLNNPAAGSASASTTVGTSPCTYTAAAYVSFTVTTDVQAFVSGTSTNSGWMMRDSTENSVTTRTATYSTKNLNTLAQAPQLVVTYT